MPPCLSAAQSTWPCCGVLSPWAPGSSGHCLDSMMPSTSIRCVPWGHSLSPIHMPMPIHDHSCQPGQCPCGHGCANALHTCCCWHPGLSWPIPFNTWCLAAWHGHGGVCEGWPVGGSSHPCPTEYLPLCAAGRGGWAAAGGCSADGSRAQWACPREVRAAPLPWLPHRWAEDDPDMLHAPLSPSGLLGTTARGLLPMDSAYSIMWP